MKNNVNRKKCGRKPKKEPSFEEKLPDLKSTKENEVEVKCGKCDFKGSKTAFQDHNLRKHVCLGWVEGETPVNINDEQEVIRLLRTAFKQTKKATCETCQVVKKSFMGFASHIRICGKSEEEKNSLKIKCPYCFSKCLKYSLPVHIKLSHPSEFLSEDSTERNLENTGPPGKRKSALRAATKFQEVLSDSEDQNVKALGYFFFEKGNSKFPKVCHKLNNIWYKYKKDKKGIPCSHSHCKESSSDVREAKIHHFTCPRLPETTYMCELCEFYTTDKSEIQLHVDLHKKRTKKKRVSIGEDVNDNFEENNGEFWEEMDEKLNEDERKYSETCDKLKNRRRTEKLKKEAFYDAKKRKMQEDESDEILLKRNFCKRENLENYRGLDFYSNCLEITLEEEISEEKNLDSWPEFNSEQKDWCHIPFEVAALHLPELLNSVSVCLNETNQEDIEWRRIRRFEGNVIAGVPIFFAGGSIRSLSWCKVSCSKKFEKSRRQFLALTTSKKIEFLRDIHDSTQSSKTSILQIWDCGILENGWAKDVPKFALGIIHEEEVWDLAFFPSDTSFVSHDNYLKRLGLLATAANDGAVRIWSICDPYELVTETGLPIYQTSPRAKLIIDRSLKENCLQLSVGKTGIIVGGYSNGVVAVWNLKNIFSPFSKVEGKCSIVKAHLTIQAHKAAITSLSICPSYNRFIASGSLDRKVKIWDLDTPNIPIEQFSKEVCLGNIWLKNWPLVFYNYDDIIPSNSKGTARFIKDVLSDRHQTCLNLQNTCLSLTFSDWLNTICGSSDYGDIKIRLLKNFISDQKKMKSEKTISTVHLKLLKSKDSNFEKISDAAGCTNEKEVLKDCCKEPETYDEFTSSYGLLFRGKVVNYEEKHNEFKPDVFPIRAVNRVCFNPNFQSFTHIAAGYNCGLVRIIPLEEFHSNNTLKIFLQKALIKLA